MARTLSCSGALVLPRNRSLQVHKSALALITGIRNWVWLLPQETCGRSAAWMWQDLFIVWSDQTSSSSGNKYPFIMKTNCDKWLENLWNNRLSKIYKGKNGTKCVSVASLACVVCCPAVQLQSVTGASNWTQLGPKVLRYVATIGVWSGNALPGIGSILKCGFHPSLEGFSGKMRSICCEKRLVVPHHGASCQFF